VVVFLIGCRERKARIVLQSFSSFLIEAGIFSARYQDGTGQQQCGLGLEDVDWALFI